MSVTMDLGKVGVLHRGEHDSTQTYERNDIVMSNGSGYIAKQNVPVGIDISNSTYWGTIVVGADSSVFATKAYTASTYATIDDVSDLQAAVGSPLVANAVADMTDTEKVYVYTGSETGYTSGNWYYYNGSAWVSGGTYNSQAIGDGTVTLAKLASDIHDGVEDIPNIQDDVDRLSSYFVLPENYDRLTDKTALSNKAFDQTGNIINGGSLVFPMYIPVEPNTTYVGSGFNYYGSARGYDENKDFVVSGVTVDVKKITTGANTHFVRFCVNNNATASNVIFQKGSTASTVGNVALANGIDLSLDAVIPFSTKGVSELNKIVTRKISAFEVHCADPTAKVKLVRVMKAAGSPQVTAVVISVNGTTYNVLNVLTANYTETAYNKFDLGDIYGYFIIDWSTMSVGNNYTNIGADLKQENILPFVEKPKYEDVEILLPSTINAVVGHEISLEYYNIIKCSNVDEFQIEASVANAQVQNLSDRLRIVPTSVGTTSITLNVYKNSVLIASKAFTLNAVADSQPTIKALFLGDSMTNQGYFLAELKNLLGNNLTLYGTRSTTADDSDNESRTVLHEGRAGWSTTNYINDASYGGVANPFYNNGFDFSYYMTNNPSFNDVTDVFILLGTNDGAGTNVEVRYKAICDSIKAFNNNIRIHCMLPIPPIRSGYAFGTRNYANYLTFKGYMFNTAKKYMSLYDGEDGYFIVPVNANINCYYDFPQTEVAVNSRNPQLIAVGNDNVHPSKYGYFRFSDVIYADIIANCQ